MTDPTPQAAAPQPAAPLSETDDKLWAQLSHFLNIILLIPALIIYLVFGPRGARTRVESKEALNWTINVTGAAIILGILTLIPFLGILFSLLYFALIVVNIIFAILGGVKVNAGGSYRYPVNIRWIK
ncbi:DUF4870 domain-containing protein [Glaciihabitans sp. UYNi722]|uniref:DUF4870 domain-containing protein n=1 Tax=Glaciihabitans sp. UYNi722 TaxID=3156344 RepID=UPI0033920067